MSGLAWGAMVALGLLAILSLVRIVVALDLRSAAGGSDGGAIVDAYDTYSGWISLWGVLFLISAGVFIAWFFRAYKNLRRLGVQNMRYRTGWAIGSWFVPILGLFRPKQIANDVWRGSERGVDVSTQWRQVGLPGFLQWWWGLFLVMGFLVELGQRITATGYNKLFTFEFEKAPSRIETGTTIDALAGVFGIVAAILAIMVVSRISKRLDEIRGEALPASGQ